jgi:hypothetical protein
MRPLYLLFPLFGFVACQSSVRGGADVRPTTGPTATPPPPASAAPVAKGPRPTNKAGCDACKGLWAVHGIADSESCICKTNDAGKACRDGAECEGMCMLAEDANFEVVEPGPPPRGHYVGRCSEYDTVFGCHRMIPNGTRAKGPAVADEAAQRLCVD